MIGLLSTVAERVLTGSALSGAIARYRNRDARVVRTARARGQASYLDVTGAQRKLRPEEMIATATSGRPRWTTFDSYTAISQGMRGWAYICAMRNATAISSLDWRVARRNPDGTWEADEMHPVSKLLRKPNQNESGRSFIKRLNIELDFVGNTVIVKNRIGTGEVKELFTARPHLIAPVVTQMDGTVAFVVKGYDNREYTVEVDDTVHIQEVNPDNPWWGMGRYQAALRQIQTDQAAADWNKYALDNMMVPPGIFLIPGHLEDDAWDDLNEQIDDEYRGAMNARKPMVLGGGGEEVQYKPLAMAPVDMDYSEGRRLTREEILAVWGTPPPVVGLLERATYSNIETARKIWWEDTLTPRADLIADGLTYQLIPEFGDDPEQVRVEYDASSVDALLDGFERRLKMAKDMAEEGVPWNAAQERVGLGLPVEGVGDVSMVNSSRAIFEDMQATGVLGSLPTDM